MKALNGLKKTKVGGFIGSFLIGALNSNPVTSIITPSIKDYKENLGGVDLDGDGSVGKKQINGSLVAYYALSYIGVGVTLFLIIWGLKNSFSQDQIEWGVELLLKSLP